MSLPGKLCVGILEEDNPLKSYFRFKPLLVYENDGYRPFDGARVYAEDGCLRIVPDKNESGHFKARMRRIGRYALLDLRAHAGENDKIRPNKNYRVDSLERNAYIVYSDVVIEPAAGMLYEILDRAAPEDSAHMALTMPLPGTRRVLFRGEDGVAPALWRAEPMEGVEGAVELAREEVCARLEGAIEARLAGFAGEEHCLLLAAPGESLLTSASAAAAPAETRAAAAPEEAPPQTDAAPPLPREASAPDARPARLSPRAQAQAAQTGLNPRRNRTLQEIIDDKWRRSRIDQLGHPVPAEAITTPVESPVERAVEAMRAAWRIEEARPKLAEAAAQLEGLEVAVRRRADRLADEEHARRLDEMEAQRLRLLNEIGALETRRAEAKSRLLEEVRAENARQMAEDARRLEALKAETDACEERARDARAALEAAEAACAEVEKRLAERALENRVVRHLRAPRPPRRPEVVEPGAGELISGVRAWFAAAGMPLSHDRAVELLAMPALSPVTVLCGPPSAPTGETARVLAEALGLPGCRRLLLPEAEGPETALEALSADEDCPAPAMLLVEDCNAPGREASAHGLILRLESRYARNWPARLVLTAREAGAPLPPELIDRAFLARLEPEAADSPWHIEARPAPPPARAISRAALARVFSPRPECVGEEAVRRMARLRADLDAHSARLSRRALEGVWSFCAAVTPLMRERTPLQVLDLALARRALPSLMAQAPLEALKALPEMVADLEECRKLLQSPLPIF